MLKLINPLQVFILNIFKIIKLKMLKYPQLDQTRPRHLHLSRLAAGHLSPRQPRLPPQKEALLPPGHCRKQTRKSVHDGSPCDLASEVLVRRTPSLPLQGDRGSQATPSGVFC